MELTKKYRYIIAGILVLLVLIIMRNSGTGHFRYDANKWAEPSFSGANIIDSRGMDSLSGEELLVSLTPDTGIAMTFKESYISIPYDSILSGKYRKVLGSHNGSIILYSSDISVSAKIWMALRQSGFREIFILDPYGDEVPVNKKFRTDTLVNPEL
jgi:hypothetical protein